MLHQWLSDLGIDDSTTIAGFCGGVVHVFWAKRKEAFAVISSCVCGTLIASFLGSAIAEVIHFPKVPTSFVVGFCGLEVMTRVLDYARKKFPNGGPANGRI